MNRMSITYAERNQAVKCSYDQASLPRGMYIAPVKEGFPFHYTYVFKIEVQYTTKYERGALRNEFDVQMPDGSHFTGLKVFWDEQNSCWRPELKNVRSLARGLSNDSHAVFREGMSPAEVVAKLAEMRFPPLCPSQKPRLY